MKLRICIFTTAHPWDDVRVKSKFVDSFLEAGDEVTWIGPDVAFFEAASDRDPRVTYRTFPSRGGWSGRLRLFHILRAELQRIPDVDWIYTPDPDAAALALSARTAAKIVFDIHEEYHKGHLVQSLPSFLMKAVEVGVKVTLSSLANRVHLVTAVNQSILDVYHAPAQRRLVTFNTPPEWFTHPKGVRETQGSRPLRLFHGKALSGNGTGVILSALNILRRLGLEANVVMLPSPGSDMAPYDPDFHHKVAEAGVSDLLDLQPAVPHRKMPGVISQANVGLIAYDRTLGIGSLPNRFFEYMSLGMPVIVPEYSPLMRRIVEAENIGWIADFEDPHSVAQAIANAIQDPSRVEEAGRRARAIFLQKYSWEPIFQNLRQRMLNSKGRP